MTPDDIERLAQEVLAAHDENVLPIDPFKLAQLEGIRLAAGHYDGCFDSRIECHRRGGQLRFYMFYAAESQPWRPEGRVRFSVGHELGHFYLPQHREFLLSGKWHGSNSDFVSDKTTEREADFFSAALLMPERHFVREVKRLVGAVCTMKDLSGLASQAFRTSLTSTAIRYAQLDFEPCCIALSRDGTIQFSMSSPEMRRRGLGWIEPGSRLPPSSNVGQHLREILEKRSGQLEGETHSDVWFRTEQSRQMWEESRALGPNGFVLTLLTLQEKEEDDESD